MIPIFKKGFVGGKTILRLTSILGMRRGRMHNGIDIGTSVGTKIYAPTNGKIILIRTQPTGAGLYIKLRFYYESNVFYDLIFMHLHQVVVSIGDTVKEGQLIAYSGGATTDKPKCGRSTGAHLHFEIRKGSVAVNPIPFLSEKCIFSGRTITSGRTKPMLPKNIDDSVSNYTNIDITNECDESAIEDDENKTETTTKVSGVNERLAPGIWQIVKLVIDKTVSNRQLYDSSISMQTGALINWFNKVCQRPLIEFSGDTFGDQYFFLVRKPPFDFESMKRIENKAEYFQNINEKEILSSTISWNQNNIFSWYQMIPYGETCNISDITLFMPAIFFPEYAAIWGSRDLTVQNQYVNFYKSGYWDKQNDNQKEQNSNQIIKNSINDLKYIIESNAYNPFIRSGQIILNGNRKIKRGTFILMPNREQFYVDAVANTFSVSETSVERTTTLTVSHGMFIDFIKGVEFNGTNMSYFNLIDFNNFDSKTIKDENWQKILSSWKVNIDVFSYFLKKSQILSTYINKQNG